MKQKTIRLGPWPLGIDQVSDETALRADEDGRAIALRDAVNADVDRSGIPARRRGARLVQPLAGARRLWACPLGAVVQVGSELYGSTGGDLVPLATLNSADAIACTVLDDAIVVANRTTLLCVRAGAAEALGLPDAPAPQVAAVPDGGLAGGRYSVAAAFVRAHQVGGLSGLRTVEVPHGGGLRLTGLASSPEATGLRIYRTEPGGETLYRAMDVPVGLAEVALGAGEIGTDAATTHLRRMPGGEHVAAWQGRLLVARGRTLHVSQPMAPHLHSPRHGFVQFPQRVTLLAPVEAGVFVGTRDGVVFLRGTRPRDWVQEQTGAQAPIPGSALALDGALLNAQWQLGGQRCVAWLAGNGYVIGTEEGRLIEAQADRIDAVRAARAGSVIHGRRVLSALA